MKKLQKKILVQQLEAAQHGDYPMDLPHDSASSLGSMMEDNPQQQSITRIGQERRAIMDKQAKELEVLHRSPIEFMVLKGSKVLRDEKRQLTSKIDGLVARNK